MNGLLPLGFILLTAVLLLLLSRRPPRAGKRPLTPYKQLAKQAGLSIESGRPLQISLGRASLTSHHSSSSLAAHHILNQLARESCAHNQPPIVNVGEGTLLPLAAANLRQQTSVPHHVQFLANENNPFAYASGIINELQQAQPANFIAVGYHGSETALMGYAAQQQAHTPIIGTTAPDGLAAATAVSDHLLIGEDLLAAGAYLQGQPAQTASLHLQDIMRWLLAAAILGAAISHLLT